jgi:acetyl-CoA carboxylase alpha subunit
MAPSTREDILRRLSEEVSGMAYKERKALEGASTSDIARAVSRMVTKRLKLYLLIAGIGFVGFTLSVTMGTNVCLLQSSRFPILCIVAQILLFKQVR